ncbi:MAG TPA: hypothetical protein VK737_10210 [Opitutales bacterium]|jgi:hypothetical protein|nr:hypothetical protein [Opitutales bacterium]
MDDFEQYLKSQPLRAVPPEWREDILAQATAAAGGKPAAVALPWWQAWLWPSPYAWGALAAAWAIILVLNFASQQDSGGPASGDARMTQLEIIAMMDERRLLMDAFYAEINPPHAPPPPPAKLPDAPGATLERQEPEEHPLA